MCVVCVYVCGVCGVCVCGVCVCVWVCVCLCVWCVCCVCVWCVCVFVGVCVCVGLCVCIYISVLVCVHVGVNATTVSSSDNKDRKLKFWKYFNCDYRRQPTYVQRNMEVCSCEHFCIENVINFIYSECVYVALLIHHAMCMHHFFLSTVVCPAVTYFLILSHKRHDFRKRNFIEPKMCVLNLYKFVGNISFEDELRDIPS